MDMLRTIGMFAVIAGAMMIPGANVFAAGGALAGWGAFAGAASAFAGSLLLNALIPPQQQKINSYRSSPTYSVTGMRNTSDPYGPVTRIFGKHITYPKYAAKPYTELVGSEQYLRCLFLIGKGRYVLSGHKIGETAIGSFSGVQMEQYYSGGSNHFALFPSDINEEALSIELTAAGGWQSRTTAADTDEISFELTFPSGLYDIASSGNRSPETVVFEVQYAPSGSGSWINLGVSKELYFSGMPSSAIAAGQSVVGQSSGAVGTVRYAHKNGAMVDTGETNEAGQPIYNIVQFCDWVRVEESSGHFIAGENVLIAGSVTAGVSTLVDLGSQVSISAQHNELYRYGYTIKVPRGTWDLRIRRTTADGRADTVDASYWTALRSISYEAPWNLAGCTLVALRIKASGQLNGVIDQFNCIAEAIVPAHDGTSWTEVKTRNPAWAFCEVLRGNSNERPVPDSRLDLATIRTWAANCEAAGRTFDAVVDFKTSVREICQDICTVGRASRGMVNGAYTVIEDTTRSTPRQHFTQRNCWGISGGAAFPDRPHALKVRFFDAASNYAQVERIVCDDGYTEATATKFETLDLFGCTSADQAWKWGRYMIACARLRAERWEINVDFEHLRCTRGDLVLLSHDAISVGVGAGRIASQTIDAGNITTMTFDDVFPMESGKSYGIVIRNQDGTTRTAGVNTSVGDNWTISLNPPIPSWQATTGDLVVFGEVGLETIQALVQRIMPGKNFTARLTLIPYSPAVLTADGGVIPAYDSGITVMPVDNRLPATPNIVSTSYSIKDGALYDDGTVGVSLVVIFEAAGGFSQSTGGASAPDVIQGFQAEWRFSGNSQWESIPVLPSYARRFVVEVKNDRSYDVRVRSFSLPGLYSAWDTESAIAVALSGTTPADVTGLQVAGGGTSFLTADCPIEWTPVTGGGTAGLLVADYQVEVRTSDGLTILRTVYVTDARYTYTLADNLADGGPRASLQFRVKARSRWGDLSAAAASLTATNPAPGNPSGLGSRSFMGGVEFYWSANTESDFSHFLYRLKLTSGGSWGSWQRTARTGFARLLSPTEKDTHGADAEVYIEVKAVDLFAQESGSSADSELCGSLNVKETDIDDFAVSASKIFTKIPVIQGLSLTDNSPAAGRVAWSACTVYYNGVAYSIAAGNTAASDQKYIYWKDLAATFATSATHPASIAGWVPGEDFVIGVNIGGIGQQAWNAIANQVIGSAYIENLGVLDAHIQSLSGTKIQATSSLAIGPSTTFGTDGIQLEYNAGNPRFYAGDGSNNFLKFDGTAVTVSGLLQVIGGSSGNLLPNGDFAQGFTNWTPATGASMSSTFNLAAHQSLKVEVQGANSGVVYSSPIRVSRSVDYIASAYVKTPSVTKGNLYVQVYEYSDTEGATYLSSIGIATVSATQDWNRHYIKIGPNGTAFNASTRSIRVAVFWWNATSDPYGSAYVDAVQVEQVDSWVTLPSKFSPQCASGSADFAVGSAVFGQAGCQIFHNAGTPKMYVGDGANNYFKFDGVNVELSTSKANALVIKNNADILIESGGDILMDASGSLRLRTTYNSVSYDVLIYGSAIGTHQITFDPQTGGVIPLNIGNSASRFSAITLAAKNSLGVNINDGTNSNIYQFLPTEFRPSAHKTADLGGSGDAWDDAYADDFNNVADFLHLDTIDDLAVLKDIKGSGQVDPETGHELINDDTLPDWLLARTRAGAIERDPDGKPYIRLKVLLSLLMGACRQLDGKIAAVGAARRV